MKQLTLLLTLTILLSGCVMYEPHYDGRTRHHDHDRWQDRDHDGVPDRQDRRPDDPRRY